MVRGKVKHRFIDNNASRRVSYRKRMISFKKMLNQLTTLCGVMACAIIYGPYDQTPEIWPNQAEASRILTRFQNCSHVEITKNMSTQEDFLKKRIQKLKKEHQEKIAENRRHELETLMYKFLKDEHDALQGISYQNSVDFEAFLDEKWLSIQKELEIQKNIN
ncbi:Agamous-like mads-box protein agl80 [Thalictrum thalictroides]|uniref:Agamous-like mads-box protein agl80 n=1 Tax=Thalictrum thalictroides TaxID=46969 RepID=A0A7J6WKL9_THATH|nr:Agamous-like mads-box protein agl80 [Thalictrum thalictroides]